MRERLYSSWSSISPKQIVSYRLSIIFLHLSFFRKFKNTLILGFHIKYLWGWILQGKTSVKSLTTQRFKKSLPYWQILVSCNSPLDLCLGGDRRLPAKGRYRHDYNVINCYSLFSFVPKHYQVEIMKCLKAKTSLEQLMERRW